MKLRVKPPSQWFPEFEPEVDHALFLIGHRNLLTTGRSQLALSALVALAVYKQTNLVILIVWLACLMLVGLSYMVLYQ
ncbi:hypothetical protein, partial [Rhodoferax sp.]|uniref:hypothetical protein n=1 Tax=Rhodoferax sp. TaxID=50421 RepID=UPI0026219D0C